MKRLYKGSYQIRVSDPVFQPQCSVTPTAPFPLFPFPPFPFPPNITGVIEADLVLLVISHWRSHIS